MSEEIEVFARELYTSYVVGYPESWMLPRGLATITPPVRRSGRATDVSRCRRYVRDNSARAYDAVVSGVAAEWHSALMLAVPANAVLVDERRFADVDRMWASLLRRGIDDWAVSSTAHRFAAQACARLGRFDEAGTRMDSAIDAALRSAEGSVLADAYYVRAWIEEQAGFITEAHTDAMRSLHLAREAGYTVREVDSLNAIGVHAHALGHMDDAIRYCNAASELAAAHGLRKPRLAALDSLADMATVRGDHAGAVELLTEVESQLTHADEVYHLDDVRMRLRDARLKRAAAVSSQRNGIPVRRTEQKEGVSTMTTSTAASVPVSISIDTTRAATRIGAMPTLGVPSMSADGSVVAVGIVTADIDRNTYDATMWISRRGEPAQPWTAGGSSDGYSPAVSPDGRWVVFARVPQGSSVSQLFLADVDGMICRQITESALGVNSGRWNPSSSALAFVTRIDVGGRYAAATEHTAHRFTGLGGFADGFGATFDRPRSIQVVHPFDGPGTTIIADASLDATDPSWSPDGSLLTFTGKSGPDSDLNARNSVFACAADGSGRQLVASGDLVMGCPRFGPDGRSVFVAGEVLDSEGLPDAAASFGVWRAPSDGRAAVERITDEEPYHIGFACQTQQPVDAGILAGIDRRGATHLVLFDFDGSERDVVIGGERQVNGFVATSRPDGSLVVAAVVTSARSGGDLILTDGSTETQLTHFGDDLERSCGIHPVESFETEVDGVSIQGWKVLPPGEGPFPTVLSIKGGPFTQFGYTLNGPAALDDAQLYADAGIAMVLVNPRGTSGYGQAHGKAASPLAPVTELDLLAALTNALKSDARLDAGRVGVTGGSFGGYMTAWLAARAPEMFRAGLCERGVYEIDSFAASGDDGWNTATALYGRDRGTWAGQSPVTYADEIDLPLLIMHSYGDGHCPFDQARRLFFELRLRHKDVELFAFGDEGHELSRSGSPANRMERLRATLDWWDRWLCRDLSRNAVEPSATR